ncbi:conjugal transfer protein TraX [Tissierella sp. MSJ-40]|uniref:Conjugal transfer protein TraX n=1 Tax=Tissierella simiarum TaxID=2841534 RepID=A0ABS6EDE0_9FIRM|nr:TraX family protein [Tissierella simiarum]MBU5440183.1 conjugal transfer protein TraX [Tissierella simiarum]
MTGFQLKLLAIITMLIDHIGAIFFPQYGIFKIIGRLAFPIFAFFIAQGYLRTRNVKKYMLRLFIIALISQIPFLYTFREAFGEGFSALNTIFNLLMGLIAIYLYDKSNWKGRQLFIWIFAILSFLLKMDGDITGVFMVYFFYKYHDDFKKLTGRMVILYILYSVFVILYFASMGMPIKMFFTPEGKYMLIQILVQFFALLALIPIKTYNGQKGYNLKYLFYIFYPAHLIILYLIKYLIK